MTIHRVESADDPVLEPFRDVRGRNWLEQSGIFIAEGPQLVEALLASSYSVRSILLDEKYSERFLPQLPESIPIFLTPHALVKEIVGFDFHRGMLAAGVRKPRVGIRELRGRIEPTETLVATVGVQDPENLGSVLRSCSGLGIRRVMIGPDCCDPFSRRALRVAMAMNLNLEIYFSSNVEADMKWLHAEHAAETIVACLSDDSEPLETARRNGPAVIFVGNERNGLPQSVQSAASRRVRINMELGTDSLNVGVAAGIILHYFTRIASSAANTQPTTA